jgi:site-specific recombinase XerD
MVDAVIAFQAQYEANASETKRRYDRVLRYFQEFCVTYPLTYVDQADLEVMDHYAVTRNKLRSWNKDVELLVQFFDFCRDRGWTNKNPARALRIPTLQPNDVVPYTRDEVVKIIAACDGIGKSSYERRRARAMVLLMRFAGLRISDVVTLSREHIKDRRLQKRAVKNKKWIWVELPSTVLDALDLLPPPKRAGANNKRFFYSDTTGERTLVKAAWRTMHAVFERSGVVGAHPHRFRHTLASELLGKGGSIEELAGILGDSPAIVSRYYAKWTEPYQMRQDALMRKIHDTDLAQAERQASN